MSGETDWERSEPVASCARCGMNIYEDDFDGTDLCDQCEWWDYQAMHDAVYGDNDEEDAP